MRQKRNQKLTGLIILLLAFILSYVLVAFYFFNEQKRIYERFSENLKDQIEITLSLYADMSDLVFNSRINNEDILELLQKAYNTESEELKNSCREQLHEELVEIYDLIKHYNFRQLHFHEPNNKSFLRMHKPGVFGDDLTGIRYSCRVNIYPIAV